VLDETEHPVGVGEATVTERLADRAVERRMAGRRSQYGSEMRRIVETTFDLIQQNDSLEPSMRDILAATGLSTQAFYRYFASKDELMLALLDEGRRRLMATLERRMRSAGPPADQLRAWTTGVLAQAADATAAARTRPWMLSEPRLTELFPEEQRASVELLVGLLQPPIAALRGATDDTDTTATTSLATMVYRLTFATLREHLVAGTAPTAEETAALVAFCRRGVGSDEPFRATS
jgi:AcrR family transcriptional regulator